MKHLWLSHANHRELLLFFNGWGMNEQPVRHLDAGKFDILMLFDYTTVDCELEFTPLFEQYDKVHLAAWSLGVWAASEALPSPCPAFGLAINGTLHPIDEQRGIPPPIFQATLDSWDEEARKIFNRRICDNPASVFGEEGLQRPASEQRRELASLQQRILSCPALNESLFTRAIIGGKDRIFRQRNQERAWRESNVPTACIDAPHYPFALCDSWREVINLGRS